MQTTRSNSKSSGYPLFLQIAGRPVLVIGGNDTAARKSRRLLDSGARIDLVHETLCQTMRELMANPRTNSIGHDMPKEGVGRYALVLVAEPGLLTKSRLADLYQQAMADGVVLNVVDHPQYCTAYLPAVVDRDPVLIAIGTGGHAPELARMIRSRLEALLPASIGPLARLAGSLQTRIRQKFPDFAYRRRFLHWLLTDAPARAIDSGDEAQANRLATKALTDSPWPSNGSVALVGAGPGDPELLTLRALRLIQEADVIVHDGLVDERVLDYGRRDAELIDVAKRRGHSTAIQERIHQLLVEHARKGARVVRLKGGDPMVFGRGGEELQHLRVEGIAYQVVPGITAAVACGAYAGIPLTHRDHAQSVRLVTAHCRASIDRLDWSDLAGDRQTLAFYMAVAQLESIQAHLIAHGRRPDTPIAIVENGTRPDQRVVTASLDRLVATAANHNIQSPAMLYIGEVAGLAETLAWFGGGGVETDPGNGECLTALAC
jgi:uroporphyrin-III C-methyltransferase / precorrin-2 dehydrogenase / sirohydrochlorin ferrochelatase